MHFVRLFCVGFALTLPFTVNVATASAGTVTEADYLRMFTETAADMPSSYEPRF